MGFLFKEIENKYSEFIDYWNELYQKTKEKIDGILKENEEYQKSRNKLTTPANYITYTYIIEDQGWMPLRGYTAIINGKSYRTDNSGVIKAKLKKGTDPTKALAAIKSPLGVSIKFNLALGKGNTLTYHVERQWLLKSPCTKDNPCYHFTTYNWHESDDKIAYTKDWKGNWLLTKSPPFNKIKKIILVWWNGDSNPQDTKFSFLTLYDKEKQRKSDPTQFFYNGVNSTLHMSLFGYAKAVIYTILEDGKIIAYSPLSDNSNENAISQVVNSYPTKNSPTIPDIFKRSVENKITGRPPKPANIETKINTNSHSTIKNKYSSPSSQSTQPSKIWLLFIMAGVILIMFLWRK